MLDGIMVEYSPNDALQLPLPSTLVYVIPMQNAVSCIKSTMKVVIVGVLFAKMRFTSLYRNIIQVIEIAMRSVIVYRIF